jgi:hypothetical protein
MYRIQQLQPAWKPRGGHCSARQGGLAAWTESSKALLNHIKGFNHSSQFVNFAFVYIVYKCDSSYSLHASQTLPETHKKKGERRGLLFFIIVGVVIISSSRESHK